MAARTVYKLFTKTYPYSLNSSPIVDKSCRKSHRSASQTPKKHPKETFFQERKLSRSFQNLKERSEDVEEEVSSSYQTDFSREVAKEFKEKPKEEKNDEYGNPIYELAEATRTEENYYDVLSYMRKQEVNKMNYAFVHLQPSQLRPFGSNENLHYTGGGRRKFKIVYPVSHTSQETGKKKFDDGKYREFSSYGGAKVYPGYEERKKATVNESRVGDLSRKKYSTSSLKGKNSGPRVLVARRKSSSLFQKMRKKEAEIKKILKEDKVIKELHRRISNSNVKEKKRMLSPDNVQYMTRKYNTQETPSVCSDFVKVKLGDLQEQCRKEKRCKPKKISFGRLPKLPPPDCPCIEDLPLKEGKPILRLKKRFDIPDRDNTCPPVPCEETPRADANLKIVPKTLRPIVPQDCPCEEPVMTDFVIKRLPKKKIPEPPKICDCVTRNDCCPPRADGKIQVKRKVLPKLRVSDCPCVEDVPLKGEPLKRMKPVKIPEPKRECPQKVVCDVERADKDLKVERKVLPQLNGECACVEGPKMREGQPLRRLPKVEFKEPKRVLREECIVPCKDAVRADKDLKVKKKKLPVFHAQDCPCIEQEIPGDDVKLKRLVPRFKYKDPEKGEKCKEVCGPRADDGMVIKPKQLPQIEPKDCPCVEIEFKDSPPLKRLHAKPVKEPPRPPCPVECTTPRSDENLKIHAKNLPVLPPGNCPCVEIPPPDDVKPLKRLKKKTVVFKRVCPVEEDDCAPRADENLKVTVKKLPKLEVGDCPCLEMPPPENVAPLKRLPKKEVKEPLKVCPPVECEEPDRADDNDWMYWKKVEVKPAECEPKKDTKRSFSTLPKRYYSTKSSIELLPSKELLEKSYNVIIDIKPSAPLILTQTPLGRREGEIKLKPLDCVRFVIYKNNSLSSKHQENSSEVALVFNSFNRSISTCSTLCEYSSKEKLKDHQTPQCECPKNDRHLQPKHPIIKEKEQFLDLYPPDDFIDDASRKGRMYCRGSKEDCGLEVFVEGKGEGQVCEREVIECEGEEERVICEEQTDERMRSLAGDAEKKLGLWERIVNYFKARPDCPTPEEFKKMRLREAAERAAEKAGLCLYDPKEMLRKTQKELPKVITADSCQK